MPIESPVLIGISGGSGSGKTFILKRLLDHYPTEKISVISQDQYYLPLENQKIDESGNYNFDDPSGIDGDALYNDICLLCQGKTVKKWEYAFNNPSYKPGLLEVLPAQIIVIEGLFIFHFEKIASIFDIKVFVSADSPICLKRRINRDFNERALSETQVRYQWENHVKPAFSKYLLPYQESSDCIIENTGGEPDLKPLFEKIEKKKQLKSGLNSLS